MRKVAILEGVGNGSIKTTVLKTKNNNNFETKNTNSYNKY